ncbi:hypothetical protein B0E42_13970 [Pseudomonas sp. A25(2017)]|uniref:hypothetical protein n=1 Tax=Pseudomonas sp. A25(2017) TaxID=1945865 RepID=UPI000986C40E|nr:hypothetical protein [Pseudomonas sp. A25(2017)]OOG85308.1 hypothetical protein B0E42_13970 [Pseudomonas sp. A25(2017)]
MAFQKKTKQKIASYVEAHLPDEEYYKNYFWFISDAALKIRLADEFKTARYIYKLLEGLQVKDELLVAQCKIQILLYASIYEAVLHHILLQDYASTPEVINLTTYEHKKRINVSQVILGRIQTQYNPVGAISVFENEKRSVDERKIVFEDKAETARQLGLIDLKIKGVICDVYSMRNAIHLHAEIRRGVTYDLEAAQKAYWHLQGFTTQVGDKLSRDGKATRPIPLIKVGRNRIQTCRKSWLRKILHWLSPLLTRWNKSVRAWLN